MKTSKPITATCQDISKRMATRLLISQLLLVAVLLSGCAYSTGTGFIKKFDQAKISQIKEGETTRAEVEQLLGPPTGGSMNPLTQEVTLSYFGDAHMDRPTSEKVIGSLLGLSAQLLPQHSTYGHQIISVTVSVNGKVKEIRRQRRQSSHEYGLFRPSIVGTKIDFSKVAQIHEGETTTAELEKLLGVPQLITEESHEVTWMYQWYWRKGEQYQYESVAVTLDPQGKVKKLTKDSGRGTTRFHGNSSVPLDRNNLLKIQVGKTTREEVERLLGQPQWESVMERGAMTQTSLTYLRQLKKERFSCSEQVFIMLDANGVVESIEWPR